MFQKYVQKNITEKFDTNEKLSPISINDQTEDIFPPPPSQCIFTHDTIRKLLFKLRQELSEHEQPGKPRKVML